VCVCGVCVCVCVCGGNCMEDVLYLKECNNSSFSINTIQQQYVATLHCILPLLCLFHLTFPLLLLLCLLRFFWSCYKNIPHVSWMISHPFLTPHVSNSCKIFDSQIILYMLIVQFSDFYVLGYNIFSSTVLTFRLYFCLLFCRLPGY